MKEIPLTQNKVALVEDADYEWLNQYKWWAYKSRNNVFYARATVNGKRITMHRLIMGGKNGLPIDHIDGNGLNNQRSNLRDVTVRQNCQNKHIEKTSNYPGVREDRRRKKKWRADIKINGKQKFLGYYYKETDAYQAYNDELKKII